MSHPVKVWERKVAGCEEDRAHALFYLQCTCDTKYGHISIIIQQHRHF